MARPGLDILVRATDANGAVITDARLRFKVAGTATPAHVYDAPTGGNDLGATIDADAGGAFEQFWYDPAVNYDAVLEDTLGTPIKTFSKVHTVGAVSDEIIVIPGTNNNHTLAALFRGLGKHGDTVTQNGFYPDLIASTQIFLVADRLFVGEAVDVTGNWVGSQGSILPTATEGANWTLRDSQFLVISANGKQAVTGISRSGDNTGGAAIGVGGFIINNKASGLGWALYADIQHESGASWSVGLEVAAKNKGSNVVTTPNLWTGNGVHALWLVAGGDASYGGSPANPSDMAIAILNGASTWNSGIVFKTGSLTVSGTANAIVMPVNYVIRWDVSDNTVGARLYSTITTSGLDYRIVFTDSGIQLTGASQNLILECQHTASAVNRVRITNNITGNPALISAIGSDTNVDLQLTSKGDALIIANRLDTATSAVSMALRVRHNLSGTPATGCGVGIEFEQETTDNVFKKGMTLHTVTTDNAAGSEDFDFVVALMEAGAAAAERFRVKSTKQARFASIAGDPAGLQDGDVWYNSTTNKLRVRAAGASVDLH